MLTSIAHWIPVFNTGRATVNRRVWHSNYIDTADIMAVECVPNRQGSSYREVPGPDFRWRGHFPITAAPKMLSNGRNMRNW